MSCWKCGSPTADGVVECARCEAGIPPELSAQLQELGGAAEKLQQSMNNMISEARRRIHDDMMANTVAMDWDKIATPGDLVIFLKVLKHRIFPVCEHNFECVKLFVRVWLGENLRLNKRSPAWEVLKQYGKTE